MKKDILADLLFLAVMIFISINQASAFALPDTGQTLCYDSAGSVIDCAGTGQDGEYSLNPMSYTDNGDGTVTDNNTEFMWPKEDDGNVYNWYQASGTYDVIYNPSSQNVCGSLNIGGYSDWRLSSKKELDTIVDYSIPYPGPTINTAYFHMTASYYSEYWSSTTYVVYPDLAWDLSFYDGTEWTLSKNYSDSYYGQGYVRCVRGGQYPSQSLVDNNDGTVTDNATGFMWQQWESGYMGWDSALLYCNELSLGGHSDWRLPSIKEFASIIDNTRYNPAINTAFFPNARTSFYWSSTTWAGYPRYAWAIYFWSGVTAAIDSKVGTGSVHVYTRCVRGGNGHNPSHSLTVTIDPQEGGTITSVPAGLTCSGNTCTGSFPQGTEVTFMANPNNGWLFVHWDDGTTCNPENPRTIVMDGDKTISAVFASAEKKAGAVIFVDGIQIVQILFPAWPPNYSQYLVDSIYDTFGNSNFTTLFQKRKEAITPFVWANTTWDTAGGVGRLKKLLESWTVATKITGGPLIVVSHSWGTVLAYIAISTDENIHVDKLITLGSPLQSIDPLVRPYVGNWLLSFGLEAFPRPSNVKTWHNYWTTCDPISAPIGIADKKGNHRITTDIKDCSLVNPDLCLIPGEPLNYTCHSAYFRDPVIWSEILLDATKK